MRLHTQSLPSRRGAVLAEGAFVLAVLFVLLFTLIVGGLGVFRYQQVASIAREAARYASVHGGQYRYEFGLSPGTPTDWTNDIYTNSITRTMVGLDPGRLRYAAAWTNNDNWPVHIDPNTGRVTSNAVSVRISYNWLPEVFFGGVTLTSTSVMPIAY
jgi:hypothetical protein